MKTLLCLTALLTATTPSAEPALGTWTGEGASYGPDGTLTSTFKLELVRREAGQGVVESVGKAILPDGRELPLRQRTSDGAAGFIFESNEGKGTGRCYGSGLCQATLGDEAGHRCEVTVVFDGDDTMRVLVTMTKAGKPVKVIRQSLRRRG